MLFCLLHPMDHNTGTLARKSSMLCVLLLISIAAFLVIAVPGQANAEEVGVANHTLDENDEVRVKYGSMQATTSIIYDVYKKRFPNVCDFLITPKDITLHYKGTGCTVELITDDIEEIKLTTGVKITDTCLDDCGDRDANFKLGFSNLLPFAYSRTNKDLKKLNKEPNYDVEAGCPSINKCGGKCMKETFLEVSWNKCDGDVYAYTHLTGEYGSGLKQYRTDNKKEFNLEINGDSSFKMDFDGNSDVFKTKGSKQLHCVPIKSNDAIVKPKAWKIKNGVRDLKDKYLLVFHLLPPNATRLIKSGGSLLELPPRPKCDLFIRFERPDYEFLFVPPQLPTTTVTTTTTTTTKTTPAITNSNVKPSPSPTAGTKEGNVTPTAKVKEVKDTEGKKSYGWIVVIMLAVVAVVAFGILAAVIYNNKKENQRNQELQEQQQQTEDEGEEKKEKEFWQSLGNDEAINDLNNRRRLAGLPTLEDEFVADIFSRMNQHKKSNYQQLLFSVYLPELNDKSFFGVGTFENWRKRVIRFVEKKIEFYPIIFRMVLSLNSWVRRSSKRRLTRLSRRRRLTRLPINTLKKNRRKVTSRRPNKKKRRRQRAKATLRRTRLQRRRQAL
ncbi:unnamed protein product [Meloidogyne enterolobii]|uniref:Uncharacterized protein n=1 Tax=Meloidogyne enterolobii TaxID=390850 RepID=A0ACB0ZYV9_MELEN